MKEKSTGRPPERKNNGLIELPQHKPDLPREPALLVTDVRQVIDWLEENRAR